MNSKTPLLTQKLNRASRRKLSKKNKAKSTGAKQSFLNSRNVSFGLLATAGLMTVGMTCAAAGTSTHTTANAFRNAINTAVSGDIVEANAQGVSGARFEFATDEALSVTGLNGLTIRGINYDVNGVIPRLARTAGATISTRFLSIFSSSNVVIEDIGFSDFQSGALFLDNSGVTLDNVIFNNNFSTNNGGAISVTNGSTLSIGYSQFLDNGSTNNGGAISVEGSTVSIDYTYFADNYSQGDGGAIYAFNSVVNIQNSHFGTNQSHDDGGAIYAVDSFVNIQSVTFANNSSYAEGGAIYGLGSDIIIGDGSFFVDNSTHYYGPYSGGEDGGAIFMGSQIVELNTVMGEDSFTRYFTVNSGSLDISYTVFTNNSASGNGGAISLNGTSATLFETDFYDNDSTYDGGAIYIGDTVYAESGTFENITNYTIDLNYISNLPTLDIDHANFISNEANGNGGAIYATNSNVNITTSQFSNNETDGHGGAIYAHENTVNISGSRFISNTAVDNGGAIYLVNYVTLTINDAMFEDNFAYDKGGAIYSGSDGVIDIVDTTFHDNGADEEGGAIYICDDTTLNIEISIFTYNTSSDDGGAIYIYGGAVTIIDSQFSNNESVDGDGGAIKISNYSDVTITNTTFYSNEADSDGGAIYIYGGAVTILDSVFYANYAYDEGGAIYIDGGAVTITNTTFYSNQADSDGGAIYIDGGAVTILDSVFDANYAHDEGGAIYIDGGAVTIIDSQFSNNESVDGDGGAIKISNYSDVTITNTTFYSNEADADGGAISILYSFVTILDSVFDANYASDDGGAIYAYGSNLSIDHSSFAANYAHGEGGAIYAYVSNLSIDHSFFVSNGSYTDGGAIYAERSFVQVYDSLFALNEAGDSNGSSGGAISFFNGPLVVANSVFQENSADYSGGAINGYFDYAAEDSDLYVVDSIFKDNDVIGIGSTGGAIHVEFVGVPSALEVTIWSSYFQNNSAGDSAAVSVFNADYVDINGSIFNGNFAFETGGEDDTQSAVVLYDVEQVEIGYSQFAGGGALTLLGVAYSNVFASTFNANSGVQGGAIQIGNLYGEDGGYHTFSYNTFVNNYGFEDYASSIFATSGDLHLLANVFASSTHSQSQVTLVGSAEITTSHFNFTTTAESLYATSVTWEDLDLTYEYGVIQNATAGFGENSHEMYAVGWRPSRSSVLFEAVNSADLAEFIGDGLTIPTSDFFDGARANSDGEAGLETAGSLRATSPAITIYGGYSPPPLPPLSHIAIPPAAAADQTLFLVNGINMNGTTSVINGAINLAWDSYRVNITPTLTPGSLSGIASDGVLEYVVGDGTTATVSGSGLLPLSTVQIYILSTPTLLGTFTTDSEGKFTGSLVMPSTMASGKHYLQVNGYSKQSTIASGSVAVRVQRVVESTASSQPITFKINSSRLSTKDKNLINKLVQEIRSASGFVKNSKIIVNGSASPEGIARLNSRLAKARANAVIAYLKELGISSDIIEVTQDDKGSRSAQVQVIYNNKV